MSSRQPARQSSTEQSLRFNVRASSERARLDAVRWHVEALERSAIQTRTVARVLRDAAVKGTSWLEPAILGKPPADLVLVTVQLLDDFIAGNAGGMRAHGNDFATLREALLSRARQELSDLVPDEWVRLASLVATVDRLASDLRGESGLDKDEEAPD